MSLLPPFPVPTDTPPPISVSPDPPGLHWNPVTMANASFEQGQVTKGGAFASFASIPGWTTNAGSAPLEIVSAGYNGIFGDGHWLDTQASPGGVDISNTINMTSSGLTKLSMSITAENIGGILTNPNEHVHVEWNGVEVFNITSADLGPANKFQTLEAYVGGAIGPNSLHVYSDGAVQNVGMAIDWFSVQHLSFI